MPDKILTEDFLKKYKGKNPNWGFNGLGYIIYKRTYARTKVDGTTEEWNETVARCIEGAQSIGANYTRQEAERLYDLIFNLKCNFAGRMLWQLGAPTVERYGGASLLNCFSGETEFVTENGIKTLAECSGKKVKVMSELGTFRDAEIRSFGKQKLLKLTLSKGRSEKVIFTTAEHRWFRKSRRSYPERNISRRVEDTTVGLVPGDKLTSVFGQSVKSIDSISPIGVMHGLVFGDGALQGIDDKKTAIRLCGKKNIDLLPWFDKHPICVVENGDIVVDQLPYFFKDKPDVSCANKNYLYGWLAGYFCCRWLCEEKGPMRNIFCQYR